MPVENSQRCFDLNDVLDFISQDYPTAAVQDFQLIRAKDGVHVYKCRYNGQAAVVKYFENESDRREIHNYDILQHHGIPTIRTFDFGQASIVLEDITASEDWRLGMESDIDDINVMKALAHWYFSLHENGSNAQELQNLYCEYDKITLESLVALSSKFLEGRKLFDLLIANFDTLQERICAPALTLTYNDFYWTNFVVRKDGQAAMMFDYNLMGKGYRYADFRNVCWNLSSVAKSAFVDTYNGLFFDKYGHTRCGDEQIERQIDEVAGPLYSLIIAFEKENFPSWAEYARQAVLDGSLLQKVIALF